MQDDRWQRMWEIFHKAREKPPEERPEFLNAACAGDDLLRGEVEALLQSHEDDSDFLEKPLLHETGFGAEDDPLIGLHVGRYQIRRLVGEGGMGTVYEAEQQGEVRRRVAFKVIKLGMDTREVVARFETERQALALMNHPNIAAVYDAGATPDGRPFFVMEYVAGVSITEFCDRQRLTNSERLRLFLSVCDAVQHAHQKGIIHRDLKPSNVLVPFQSDSPFPKIIDFGVSKSIHHRLTEKSLYTEYGKLIGTPEYMSPEQAERSGLDVDTRSDIYSLGVLLYEILVGTLPFDLQTLRNAPYDEVQRIIREKDPPTPSTRLSRLSDHDSQALAWNRRTSRSALVRELRGDLDWITIKAMEKDRTRRYAAASELAADIVRHLNNEAVIARPPSAAYRATKFVKRHKTGVAAGTLFLFLIVGFAVAMTVQSIRLTRALEQVRREMKRSETVSAFLVDLFRASDPFEASGQVTARELLERGTLRISTELRDQPDVQSTLMDTMGRVHLNLGLYDSAGRLLEEALATRQAAGDERLTAESLEGLGIYWQRKAEYQKAEALLREALEKRRRLLGQDDPVIARNLLYLGGLLREEGDYSGAESTVREALTVQLGLLGEEHPEIGKTWQELAAVLHRKGDYAGAESALRRALAVWKKTRGDEHPSTTATLDQLGALLIDKGDDQNAETVLRQALESKRKQLGKEHPRVAVALNNLALALYHQGQLESAETLYREALATNRKIYGESHGMIVGNLNNLGLVLLENGDDEGAERSFRDALGMHLTLFGPEHPDRGNLLTNLARALHLQRNYKEAGKLYLEGLQIRRKSLKPGHPGLAHSLTWLGKLLLDQGDPKKAEPLLREALDIRLQVFKLADRRTVETETFLGDCLLALGRPEEAAQYRPIRTQPQP